MTASQGSGFEEAKSLGSPGNEPFKFFQPIKNCILFYKLRKSYRLTIPNRFEFSVKENIPKVLVNDADNRRMNSSRSACDLQLKIKRELAD